MGEHWIFKLVVFALMACIVMALGASLYFILFRKTRVDPKQAATALTARITLSLVLFGLLFVAFALGWLKPHSLFSIANTRKQIEITTPHPQNANTTPPLRKQNGDL